MNSVQKVPTICVFSSNDLTWQWYAPDSHGRVRWIFFNEDPASRLERLVQRPKLSRILGALRCVRGAARESAVAIAAHSQIATMWCAIFLRLLRVRVPLLSFSFHFPKLPTGPRLVLLRWVLPSVQRFTVHSEPERARYSAHFGIPLERFDLVRWGVRPSSVEIPVNSPVYGNFICALGKDGRDYATLLAAMKRLPDISLVVVARPYNLVGLEIPENVRVFCDISPDMAMGILRESQFMALPLESGDTSCGHITIVSALFCRKAIVATLSSGIADYFPQNYDAPRVAARDVEGWVTALRKMAGNSDLVAACAKAGVNFAHQYCSHDVACRNTFEVFRTAGIPIEWRPTDQTEALSGGQSR